MKFMPETELGKVSLWGTIIGIILLFSLYWTAMLRRLSIPIPLGFVSILLLFIFGTISIILVTINKDRVIALFLSALLGLFAWFMIIGEFIFFH